MSDHPHCGKCGKQMTPENSTAAPEYFLCDDCAVAVGLMPRRPLHTNMKITKSQWQQWAANFADQELNDFTTSVSLTLEQAIILRAKLEAAALYGMEIAAVMDARGCDLSEAKDCKPALMRNTPNAKVSDGGPLTKQQP